jgi:hypothetical protein
LGVFDPENPQSKEIITYFVFPGFQKAFPLRSGDILVFDPRVTHCSCNPRNPNALIFSAYTSAKIVNAHVAKWMLEKGILNVSKK